MASHKCTCFTGMNCESPLECTFWWFIQHSEAFRRGMWSSQVRVGRYRVDALAQTCGMKVAFELDGVSYHEELRDALRDRELLTSLDAIVHIPFAAMTYYPYGTWMAVGKWFRELSHEKKCRSAMAYGNLVDHLERIDHGMEPAYLSSKDWMDQHNSSSDIYHMCGSDDPVAVCYVGCPRAFVANWKLSTVYMKRNLRRWREFGFTLGCGEQLTPRNSAGRLADLAADFTRERRFENET